MSTSRSATTTRAPRKKRKTSAEDDIINISDTDDDAPAAKKAKAASQATQKPTPLEVIMEKYERRKAVSLQSTNEYQLAIEGLIHRRRQKRRFDCARSWRR